MSSSPHAPQRRHTSWAPGLIPMARRVTSNVRRVMTAPAEPTYGHKQRISAYRLKWSTLQDFLKQRFPEDKYPGIKFEEKRITEDNYIVLLPEALSTVWFMVNSVLRKQMLIEVAGRHASN
ncbi:MAG: hypothetical protein LQ338_001788 [Usnochroma carphineum]|nr:MAG: hypothetical protein LQ338_001788 [Usnochroma carphineum]